MRALARSKRGRIRRAKETAEMLAVRRRDEVCRFPLCGCRRLGFPTEVSHLKHRGMGGNPAGDRTQTESMVLVCAQRHRISRYSIDRHTVRWTPLNAGRGANGPILWEVLTDALPMSLRGACPAWLPLAVEVEPGKWDDWHINTAVLSYLATMQD